MNKEDLFPSVHGRSVDRDVSVKATRSHQSTVQCIRSVGAGKHDNLFSRIETIHLSQDLIQSCFPFIIATKIALSSRLSDCIDLINEDDTRRAFPCSGEEISHS